MEKIRVLVSENIQNLEVDLRNRLQEMGFEVIDLVSGNEALLKVLENRRADVILMDSAIDGIKAATEIAIKYQTPVVFLSSDENIQNLKDIENSDAVSFISKPATDIEIYANLKLAFQMYEARQSNVTAQDLPQDKYIFVRADYKLNKIRMVDIYYAEAKKDYVTIHTSDNVFTTHSTMKDVLKVLPRDRFIRIHRSYIVNIDKIFSIKYPDLIIENKMKIIPIGGLYRRELFSKLNILS